MSKIIYTKEVLEKAVQESFYYTEVFEKLGARLGGNTYQRIKYLIKKYEIDTSHFLNGKLKEFINSKIGEKKHHSLVLVENKETRERSYLLRRALIDSGREYICEHCGVGPKWNNKELTLHTDHIDGNWTDCRKENLRFLCPNCHSQTSTFGNKRIENKCKNCNSKIRSKSNWCKRCCGLFQSNERKVENRPDLATLLEEVEELGYVGTGKKYGVSDNAIRKWIKVERKRIALLKE